MPSSTQAQSNTYVIPTADAQEEDKTWRSDPASPSKNGVYFITLYIFVPWRKVIKYVCFLSQLIKCIR